MNQRPHRTSTEPRLSRTRVLKVVCASLFVWTLPFTATHAADRLGSSAPPIVTVTQNASGGASTLSASISTATVTGSVYTGGGTNRALPNFASTVTPAAVLSQQDYVTTDAAQSAVGNVVSGYMSYFSSQVNHKITNGVLKGVVQVVYTYSMDVTITPPAGKQRKGYVSDTCFVAPSGDYSCIGAQFHSGVSYLLYVTYTQGSVANMLPPDWVLPHHGELNWALMKVERSGTAVKQTLTPIDGRTWHTIDFYHDTGPWGPYGDYDAFQVAEIGTPKARALLNCQIQVANTCTTYQAGKSVPSGDTTATAVEYNPEMPVQALGSKVLAGLALKYGADGGILLYGKMTQPVYHDNGDGTATAQVAVDITQRVVLGGDRYFFISPGGSSHYNEEGNYGYQLSQDVDEYKFDSHGTPTYVTTLQQTVVSPTEHFSKSVLLKPNQTLQGNTIINPFPTGNELYDYLHDDVNHLPPDAYGTPPPIVYK